jgi:hypothetical protein
VTIVLKQAQLIAAGKKGRQKAAYAAYCDDYLADVA